MWEMEAFRPVVFTEAPPTDQYRFCLHPAATMIKVAANFAPALFVLSGIAATIIHLYPEERLLCIVLSAVSNKLPVMCISVRGVGSNLIPFQSCLPALVL